MWKSVLQNVLYFIHELYPAAYSQSNWTCDGVDKAVSWGLYCEKIARQSHQNGSLQIAFSHLAKESNEALLFCQLQNARYHLLKSLIHNQAVEIHVQEYISEVAKRTLGSTVVARIHEQVSQQRESYKLISAYISDTVHENFDRDLKSKLMWEVADTLSSEQVNNTLSRLVKIPDGLNILLDNMKCENAIYDVKNVAVDKRIVEWLDSALRTPKAPIHKYVVQCLCDLQPTKLCGLLLSNHSLLIAFLATLHREGQKLVPIDNQTGYSWTPQDLSSSILTYKDLVTIYSNIRLNKSLTASADKVVSEWCMKDGGAIWSDVLGDVKIAVNRKELQ
ncbi:uncharacterized protein LOC122249968 isoform X1 [Penaeus japonicus]|uniref:uncharacterized protein LOC122249968 isoform X1 n=1 Tax=Penaeus japonicus TaxID=27405 RepID=UPI001C71121E|nr:uncharacterized protein LOC122249968 isoform X1 [Penaeus japonicus]